MGVRNWSTNNICTVCDWVNEVQNKEALRRDLREDCDLYVIITLFKAMLLLVFVFLFILFLMIPKHTEDEYEDEDMFLEEMILFLDEEEEEY